MCHHAVQVLTREKIRLVFSDPKQTSWYHYEQYYSVHCTYFLKQWSKYGIIDRLFWPFKNISNLEGETFLLRYILYGLLTCVWSISFSFFSLLRSCLFGFPAVFLGSGGFFLFFFYKFAVDQMPCGTVLPIQVESKIHFVPFLNPSYFPVRWLKRNCTQIVWNKICGWSMMNEVLFVKIVFLAWFHFFKLLLRSLTHTCTYIWMYTCRI